MTTKPSIEHRPGSSCRAFFVNEGISTMTKKMSRRAALAGIAALAPATTAVAIEPPDPFLRALAAYNEAHAVWDASFAPDGPHPDSGYDDYIGECCDGAHEVLLAAVRTTPTTDAGWAAKLAFLAEDPYGGQPDGTHYPLCGFVDDQDKWQDAICGALRAAAAMLRGRASVRT
jgi:hypothetical protein